MIDSRKINEFSSKTFFLQFFNEIFRRFVSSSFSDIYLLRFEKWNDRQIKDDKLWKWHCSSFVSLDTVSLSIDISREVNWQFTQTVTLREEKSSFSDSLCQNDTMTAENKSDEYIKLRVVGQDNSKIQFVVSRSSLRRRFRWSPFQSENDNEYGKIEKILRWTSRYSRFLRTRMNIQHRFRFFRCQCRDVEVMDRSIDRSTKIDRSS